MTADIEKITRRRRIMLTLSGLVFLSFQPFVFADLDQPVALWRGVDWVKASAFAFWSLVLILILVTGGFPFRRYSPATRAALNDELTRANRRAGYTVGYWAMMIGAVLLFVLAQMELIAWNEFARLLFAFGVAFPALRFAFLERRQDA